jgi:Cys-rich repeat protein
MKTIIAISLLCLGFFIPSLLFAQTPAPTPTPAARPLPPQVQVSQKAEQVFWVKQIQKLDQGKIWGNLVKTEKKELGKKIEEVAKWSAVWQHAPADKKNQFQTNLKTSFLSFCQTFKNLAQKAYNREHKKWISKNSFKCFLGGKGLDMADKGGLSIGTPRLGRRTKKPVRTTPTRLTLAPPDGQVFPDDDIVVGGTITGGRPKFFVESFGDSDTHPKVPAPDPTKGGRRVGPTKRRKFDLTYKVPKGGKYKIRIGASGKGDKKWSVAETVLDVGCREDTHCPPGEVCKDGKCVKPPPVVVVTPTPRTGTPRCKSDEDCPPGEICKNGKCVKPPEEPASRPAPAPTPPPVAVVTGPPAHYHFHGGVGFRHSGSSPSPASGYTQDKGYEYGRSHLAFWLDIDLVRKITWRLYLGVDFLVETGKVQQAGQLPLDGGAQTVFRARFGGEGNPAEWALIGALVELRIPGPLDPNNKFFTAANDGWGGELLFKLRLGPPTVGFLLQVAPFLTENSLQAIGQVGLDLNFSKIRAQIAFEAFLYHASRDKTEWGGSSLGPRALFAWNVFSLVWLSVEGSYRWGWYDSAGGRWAILAGVSFSKEGPYIRPVAEDEYYKRAPAATTQNPGTGDKPPTP